MTWKVITVNDGILNDLKWMINILIYGSPLSFAAFSYVTAFAFILGGKVAMEGKVEHKFDMKPHGENIEEYGKLCRERTNKSMIKNRQIQVVFHVYYLIMPLVILAICLCLND